MTTLKTPSTLFTPALRLSETVQDARERSQTRGGMNWNCSKVAMWVALTPHQAGRKFSFEHPAYASSWSTEVVSFVAGLEGVSHVTVDMCSFAAPEARRFTGTEHRGTAGTRVVQQQ